MRETSVAVSIDELTEEINRLWNVLRQTSPLWQMEDYLDLRRRIAMLGLRRHYLVQRPGKVLSDPIAAPRSD